MKLISKEELKWQFNELSKRIKNNKYSTLRSCVVFIYNSIEKSIKGDLHISECVYADEIKQIENAFHSVPSLQLFSFDSEDEFINYAPVIKSKYDQIFVYSMAQNLNGIGRRCLIPLLCEYYGFTNISSNSRSSFLGGDKRLMHTLLSNEVVLPVRLFLSNLNYEAIKSFRQNYKEIILKPNSESASIGVCKIYKDISNEDAIKIIGDSLREYKQIFLEEFIPGEEIECTILPWYDTLYIGDPIKIVKDTEFLDYNTVASDNYDFEIYKNGISEQIKRESLSAYTLLGFDSIARFDFMVKNGKTYLFDITPNPTISYCSSANKAVRFLNNDARTIYQLLLYQKLFIPTLY